ncbi:ESX secretion-associated protein EspG [Tomitella biformata]|uniref:ESX secretion-associated protein EspG n=1 Tax=Tomitella biformata TaxID=630403 RepID=UPI000467113E|nr:ESX secretion-associated protein EspG [Tomitella biformata]
MRTLLTAEQFRHIWRRAGGDTIHLPIQAPSRGRMVSDRDRIGAELNAWWDANEDPDLYAAVRGLRQSPSWLQLAGFPVGGKPIRALLGAGGGEGGVGSAVLAVQDATQAVRDGDNPDWYTDTAVDSAGWSLERGGDIRLGVGHPATLVGEMMAVVPEFQEGTSPALRADSPGPDAAYTTRASTTSRSERIAGLLGRRRTQHGILSASVADGAGLREIARVSWVDVAGDGGYLVHEDGPLSLKPAAHRELVAAARELLASVEAVPGVV